MKPIRSNRRTLENSEATDHSLDADRPLAWPGKLIGKTDGAPTRP
jgi:hypothetical protein